MKLCFVGDGQSVHMINFVKWFAKRDHEVYLVTDKPSIIEDVEIKTLRNISSGLFRVMSKMAQTAEWVKEIKPEILHAHYVCGYGTFAASANFNPFILTPWGSDITIDSYPFFKKRMVKYALKSADIISSEDETITNRLIQLGVKGKKLVPLSIFGVNSTIFKRDNTRAQAFKKKLVGNNYMVFFAKPLTKIYKIEKLFVAIPEILKQVPNIKFVFAYIKSDTETWGWVQNKVNQEPWKSSVVLVGSVSHNDIYQYFEAADVVVDTLERLACVSAASTEAMFCGTPVTLFRKTKPSQAPFSSYSSIGELAEEVTNILTNEEYKKGILDKASAFLAARGDEEEVMMKWEKLYESLGGTI
jgi:L-malate glycosyltransferase